MIILFDKVKIRVSELQTTTVIVAPWETPVLQALYGEDTEIVGQQKVNRDLPDASDEFARLANRYGPRNSDVPMVAGVYGSFGPGVNALRKEIKGGKGRAAKVAATAARAAELAATKAAVAETLAEEEAIAEAQAESAEAQAESEAQTFADTLAAGEVEGQEDIKSLFVDD